MKRIWMLLLACVMMGLCSGALALDLSPYVIPSGELLIGYDAKRDHTASVEEDGERQALVIFDGEGKLVCRQMLERTGRYDVAASADHPQGGYLVVLVKRADGNADETMTIRRMDEKGNILWDAAILKGFSWNWDILCGDGQGGAFFVFADPDNYKRAQAWHWDARGKLLWSGAIEAEGLVFSGFTGRFDAQKDRLVVGGHAVSKSKGVYDALILEIDREGSLEVVQRKDFSDRPDYGFDVLMDESGAFYAHSHAGYLDTRGTPRVLVPLDALPDAPQRTVSLRKEDATYYYNPDGGRKYHVQARCGSIDEKYYDVMKAFGAAELALEPYNALEPCSRCGADLQ